VVYQLFQSYPNQLNRPIGFDHRNGIKLQNIFVVFP